MRVAATHLAPSLDQGPTTLAIEPEPIPSSTTVTTAPWREPRYGFIRPLGRGGFGDVYLAHDHVRGHAVALKMVRGLPDAARAQLRHEFRIIKDFAHPGIVELFELHLDGADCLFTMEFVRGVPLTEVVESIDRAQRTATALRLIEAAPSIRGVKESSSNLAQITRLITEAPAGFHVYSGDDNMILGILGAGGAGLVSVASNQIPTEMAQMIQAALANEWSTARRLNRKYFRLMEANFCESNPGPVKAILAMMGKCGEYYRLPMVPVSGANRARLERIAGELGLLIHAPRPEGDFRMF